MGKFIYDDFMLENRYASELYHTYAEKMPIIDFHNHLNPKMIAENYKAKSITEFWLGGDHYKWRLMRANGVNEKFITGDACDYEKFEKWAQTLPYTMRNPIYHWTHLELKRYFGVDTLLNGDSSRQIYDSCNQIIESGEFGAMDLLKKMSVEVVCTTDDPIDSLEYHILANRGNGGVKVLPTWRPDRVVAIENSCFNDYIDKLEEVTDVQIDSFEELITALKKRQAHFIEVGCRLSDHGLDAFYAEKFTYKEVDDIFKKARLGCGITEKEIVIYKSGILYNLAVMNHDADWVQQFHVGPLRNNSTKLFNILGADIGCDSINDKPIAEMMGKFFDKLEVDGLLTKTVIYNLNPKDSEVVAAMCYNFNSNGGVAKMQYGAAWWFLDQHDGMKKQIETISSFGLLSRFVGMLTDSRSFLSFTRHEYFRRILCNVLGSDIEKGLLPKSEIEFIGEMVKNISYHNAKKYFKL